MNRVRVEYWSPSCSGWYSWGPGVYESYTIARKAVDEWLVKNPTKTCSFRYFELKPLVQMDARPHQQIIHPTHTISVEELIL